MTYTHFKETMSNNKAYIYVEWSELLLRYAVKQKSRRHIALKDMNGRTRTATLTFSAIV